MAGLVPAIHVLHCAPNKVVDAWHKAGQDGVENSESPRMNLGFFTMPIHPVEKDWRVSLREDREAFILADELGYTEGYVGEHHTDRAENITSCMMFICTLIDATKRIKLGTGTVNMPNNHPAAVAANVAMLDHMLDGRFIFGISPGGLMSDAEVFGNLDADRNAMFLECINQVLEIWQSDPPYNIKGKYWNIVLEKQLMLDLGQGHLPKPLQKPHPPIVVTAVAPFSKGVTEAAARGPPIRPTGASRNRSSSPTMTRPRSATPPIRTGPIAITTASCSPNCSAAAARSRSRPTRSRTTRTCRSIRCARSWCSGARPIAAPTRYWRSARRSATSARYYWPARTGQIGS